MCSCSLFIQRLDRCLLLVDQSKKQVICLATQWPTFSSFTLQIWGWTNISHYEKQFNMSNFSKTPVRASSKYFYVGKKNYVCSNLVDEGLDEKCICAVEKNNGHGGGDTQVDHPRIIPPEGVHRAIRSKEHGALFMRFEHSCPLCIVPGETMGHCRTLAAALSAHTLSYVYKRHVFMWRNVYWILDRSIHCIGAIQTLMFFRLLTFSTLSVMMSWISGRWVLFIKAKLKRFDIFH